MKDTTTTHREFAPLLLRGVVVRRLAVVTTMIGLVGFGLVFPFSVTGRRWGALFDLAHAPAFGGLLLIIAGLLDPPAVGMSHRFPVIAQMTVRRVLIIVGALLLLGLAGEFLQQYSNRSPSWTDVVANATGLLAATCWVTGHLCRGFRSVALIAAGPAILAAASLDPLLEIHETVLARRDLPRLASFERPRELNGWSTCDASVTRSTDWATHGSHSLQVTLHPGKYPGVACSPLEPDWRSYHRLLIDLRNPGQQPVGLVIAITDRDHKRDQFEYHDRFNREIELPPGNTLTVQIELNDVESAPATRTMNMAEISSVAVFAVQLQNEQVFLMDNPRLE